MEYIEKIKSENKAVRRNGLKQLLSFVQSSKQLEKSILVEYISNLPFDDSYDTCRELSFKIVFSILENASNEVDEELFSFCFNKIKENVMKNKCQEMEEVRIIIAYLIGFILEKGPLSILTKNIDDVYKIIDIYFDDNCNEVITTILSSFPSFLHRFSSIHMILEQLIRSLKKLLKHKNHTIRYHSIQSIYLLLQIEVDRNDIIMEDLTSSLLLLLNDPYDDVQNITLKILQFSIQKGYNPNQLPSLLEVLSTVNCLGEENQHILQSILETPLPFLV